MFKTFCMFTLIQGVVHSENQARADGVLCLSRVRHAWLSVLPFQAATAQSSPRDHICLWFGLCSETNLLAYTGFSQNLKIAIIKLLSLLESLPLTH